MQNDMNKEVQTLHLIKRHHSSEY